MKTTMIEEMNFFCIAIEGGLATSTPEFVQECIKKLIRRKDHNTVGVISLIKRLENIKRELTEKQNNKEGV